MNGAPPVFGCNPSARRLVVVAAVVGVVASYLPAALAYSRPGRTELASRTQAGIQGDKRSNWASISGDGRFVAFESLASTLVPGDTNQRADVFVHDRETGVVERVSVAADGTQAKGWSTGPASFSADGRYVVFESDAPNLVPGDTNQSSDVFVRDREAGTLERVSVSSDERGQCARAFSRRQGQ